MRLCVAVSCLAAHLTTWAAVDDTFTANVPISDDGTTVTMRFKVTSESPKTCQVGDGVQTAITPISTENLKIPATANGYAVTAIGGSAFYECDNLKSIEMPEGLTAIGEYAFGRCKYLTKIVIPDGVTSISNGLCYDCSGLETVSLPDGVTSIDERAFYKCSKLSSINIPEHVTSIGTFAFYNCYGLTVYLSKTLYESLNRYDSGVNYVCPKNDGETWESVQTMTFDDTKTTFTIPYGYYVPAVNNNRTLTAGDDAYTICLPYSLTSNDDIRFYELAGVDGTSLQFSEVDVTEPLKPYLAVKRTAAGSLSTTVATTIKATTGFTGGDVQVGDYVMRGTLEEIPNAEAQGKYILQSGNRWGLVTAGTVKIPAFRTYIEYVGSAGKPQLTTRFDESSETSAIGSIEAFETIDRDGTRSLFDLSGRRIAAPTRGISIDAAGRKVVVR